METPLSCWLAIWKDRFHLNGLFPISGYANGSLTSGSRTRGHDLSLIQAAHGCSAFSLFLFSPSSGSAFIFQKSRLATSTTQQSVSCISGPPGKDGACNLLCLGCVWASCWEVAHELNV